MKKKLKSNQHLVKKIYEGLRLLRSDPRPEVWGERKHGSLAGLYAYDLDRGNRILYSVERSGATCSVTLYRVCSHKQVYGED
ncbi:MAG: hypothetical protein QW453_06895 [Thermoprotei archaeon]